AVGSNDLPWRWQRILVSFAGPLAQFVLYGLLWFGFIRGHVADIHDFSDLQIYALAIMLSINWYWPVLNLLPVWPLDGGMISREVLSAFNRHQGLRWSLIVSMVCAGLLAANALMEVTSQR